MLNLCLSFLKDSTFEFEKRRNIPIRYNRELVQTTVKAIQRVSEIQRRRERAFHNNRMAVAREKLRVVRAKKRTVRDAKDKAYAEFIAQRNGETKEEDIVLEEQTEVEEVITVDVDLVQPEKVVVEEVKTVRQKVLVLPNQMGKRPEKRKLLRKTGSRNAPPSALVPSEGRSMGMEIDG